MVHRQHRLELVFFEPDILHCFAGRARFPVPLTHLVDPFSYWKANSNRLLAWHVKDGSRIVPPPAPPANPFTQARARRLRLGFTDALYAGEGSIGQGYPVDPDPAVVGFKKIFDDVGAKGSRFYIIESDSALGPVPATRDDHCGTPSSVPRHARSPSRPEDPGGGRRIGRARALAPRGVTRTKRTTRRDARRSRPASASGV